MRVSFLFWRGWGFIVFEYILRILNRYLYSLTLYSPLQNHTARHAFAVPVQQPLKLTRRCGPQEYEVFS